MQVYTEVLREDANWNKIKENLDIAGQTSIYNGEDQGIPYSSWVEIDKTSPTPKMRVAIVESFIPFKPKADLQGNVIPQNVKEEAEKAKSLSENGALKKGLDAKEGVTSASARDSLILQE